jgi:hypothetical protein
MDSAASQSARRIIHDQFGVKSDARSSGTGRARRAPMHFKQRTHLVQLTAGAAVVLTCLASTARGQQRETITALAEVPGGTAGPAAVTITIDHFATDAERDALVSAVKKGGTPAARQMLRTRDAAGTVEVGTNKAVVKHAFARSVGAGRLITVITGEPIALPGKTEPTAGGDSVYQLGLLLIEVPDSGASGGELLPAASVRVDEQGAIVTEADKPTNVVRLRNVAKKTN